MEITKENDKDIETMNLKAPDGYKHRKRFCTMSRSEIINILAFFHYNQFRNFKQDWKGWTKVT